MISRGGIEGITNGLEVWCVCETWIKYRALSRCGRLLELSAQVHIEGR